MNITRFRKMMVDSFDCATRGAASTHTVGVSAMPCLTGVHSLTQSTNR
mgnify:CR=1 FL=1